VIVVTLIFGALASSNGISAMRCKPVLRLFELAQGALTIPLTNGLIELPLFTFHQQLQVREKPARSMPTAPFALVEITLLTPHLGYVFIVTAVVCYDPGKSFSQRDVGLVGELPSLVLEISLSTRHGFNRVPIWVRAGNSPLHMETLPDAGRQ
jgi:hypothetical protein